MKKRTVKRIASEEEIRKGIIGLSFAGMGQKAFISEVNGTYFTGYAMTKTGDLIGIEAKKDFREAFRQGIDMNTMLEEGREITPKLLKHG